MGLRGSVSVAVQDCVYCSRKGGALQWDNSTGGISFWRKDNFVGHACSVTDQSCHVKNVTYIFVLGGVQVLVTTFHKVGAM